MRHGSLFSGIGGFDLAAEWMGWENVFHCEWNPFGQKVLNYYWPNAKSYGDITKTDFTIWRGKIDILTGGFPCQPFSTSGKRKGDKDSRYLWDEMFRAIREAAPGWVVAENVHGIINWSRGMVFDKVCSDLESEGYEISPVLLPASAKNAIHGRTRTWFVAYNDSNGRNRRNGEHEKHTSERGVNAFDDTKQIFDTPYSLSREREVGRDDDGMGWKWKWKLDTGTPGTIQETIECTVHSLDDGIPEGLDSTSFSDFRKWRKESLKGYGNAICPQVVYEIFKAIEECELNM